MRLFVLLLFHALCAPKIDCQFQPFAEGAIGHLVRPGSVRALVVALPSAQALRELQRQFGQTLTSHSKTISEREFLERARAFAADTVDRRGQTFETANPDRSKNTIKFHLGTGELLVLGDNGALLAYTRLPVIDGSFGKFRNSSEFLDVLTQSGTGPNGQPVPAFSAGYSIGVTGFSSQSNLGIHFRKHILRVSEDRGRAVDAVWIGRLRPTGAFARVQQEMKDQVKAHPEDLPAILQSFESQYEKAAVSFVSSNHPDSFCFILPPKSEGGLPITMKVRLSTNEVALVGDGKIVSYYSWLPEVANPQLRDVYDMPPVHNVLEYGLARLKSPQPLE
ncbi:MAG: hypothetical protein HYR96_05590 [Deltaproteobacteria bacterium]|nr:hypothetical protein [Deltaproteobacteria bacterium]MBI3295781.1 hypothetical protein [Deltaproteobacteria bacterium]